MSFCVFTLQISQCLKWVFSLGVINKMFDAFAKIPRRYIYLCLLQIETPAGSFDVLLLLIQVCFILMQGECLKYLVHEKRITV